MKQRITVEQLQELTEEQKQRLREWWKPELGDLYVHMSDKYKVAVGPFTVNDIDMYKNKRLPLLSIGQMIEMLQSYKDKDIFKYHDIDITDKNLCDALWSAVKQVL